MAAEQTSARRNETKRTEFRKSGFKDVSDVVIEPTKTTFLRKRERTEMDKLINPINSSAPPLRHLSSDDDVHSRRDYRDGNDTMFPILSGRGSQEISRHETSYAEAFNKLVASSWEYARSSFNLILGP